MTQTINGIIVNGTSKEESNQMNPSVKQVIDSYPKEIQEKILQLRQLIYTVAKESKLTLTETLKWNEPSYLADGDSTIRIAWKKSFPTQLGIYFNCRTSLIETFKEIYPHEFNYEGNRAVVFSLDDEIPEKELKHCIELSLKYHEIKHLPLLGV